MRTHELEQAGAEATVATLRVVGFVADDERTVELLATACRGAGIRAWCDGETVGVVVHDAVLEAEVRVLAAALGARPAG